MSKNKLRRFEENSVNPFLIQPQIIYPPTDHEIKGNWNSNFFKNSNPIVLELGCGRGEYTVEMAKQNLSKNFIGIDWKGARLWRGAKTTQLDKMNNTGFLRIQIQNIQHFFAHQEVDSIWITFPDPQPQKTRERKRLTCPRFLEKYKAMLRPGGNIHLKTDNRDFYEYTLDIAKQYKLHSFTNDLYSSASEGNQNISSVVREIKTTYEKKFLAEGSKICYLNFSFE